VDGAAGVSGVQAQSKTISYEKRLDPNAFLARTLNLYVTPYPRLAIKNFCDTTP
jgi:hypothetical protein